MNSIRVRVALMLVGSVLSVVVLSTLVMFQTVGNLVEQSSSEALAHRVAMMMPVVTFEGDDAMVLHLQHAPVAGEVLEEPTAFMKKAFRKAGLSLAVAVKKTPDGERKVVVTFGNGWLAWPLPSRSPPPRIWFGLAGWMGLTTIGVIGIALCVAHQATKQLKFLQTMAESVGSDGILPRVREEGSTEIKATARALNMMGDSLRKATESRIRLVAAAGHDLRTPMTRMRLRAEFLTEDERTEWLNDLDELDRIADSAIQLVREETVGKGSEPIELHVLIGNICRELALMNLPVELREADAVSVAISPLALTRALRNLIINAATHGGGARVSVMAADRCALVIIDDDGPGIPEKDISSVFEPFFRVDPARRQHIPGAGLGLAIAKEIVERQGGTLGIENRTPNGLRQTLSFERKVTTAPVDVSKEMEAVYS
jgi:signal transduction histidine kinase